MVENSQGKDKRRAGSPQYYKCIHVHITHTPSAALICICRRGRWVEKAGKVGELEKLGDRKIGVGMHRQLVSDALGQKLFSLAL